MRALPATTCLLVLLAATVPARADAPPSQPAQPAPGAGDRGSMSQDGRTVTLPHANAAPAAATTPPNAGTSINADDRASTGAHADQDFVSQASMIGIAETTLGRYASRAAAGPAVRVFGTWMVTDHSLANGLLQPLAAAAGTRIAEALDQPMRDGAAKLQTLNGPRLDHDYLIAELAMNDKAISVFQAESQAGNTNPGLKTFASQMLPVLQAHRDAAQTLLQTMPDATTPPASTATAPGASAPLPLHASTAAPARPHGAHRHLDATDLLNQRELNRHAKLSRDGAGP